MKWYDTPPVWLAGALALAYLQTRLVPALPLADWADWLGGALALTGAAIIAMAVIEFRRHDTTLVPHDDPSAMVRSGVYGWSRNPIYLGDALILAGLSLVWDSLLGLILVPLFVRVITRRFIEPEEARLEAGFGEEFETYRAQVRRWI